MTTTMATTAKRPVFLNLIAIRLPVAGVMSIVHRITGVLMTLAVPALIYLLDLSLGSVKIPLSNIVGMLLGREPEQASWMKILHMFRLPKSITAILAGAALALSGLQMQTLFRNPLAGPFVLGIEQML